MSVICQTFIQNTWKKDLCSNCFKSLADHRYPNKERNRYFLHSATPYHTQQSWSGTQEWKYLLPTQDRENNQTWSIPKACSFISQDREERRSVTFLDEAPDVIGYGGEVYQLDGFADDWESDDGEFNLDKLDETDEDRAITKLTKENTRFNTYISEKDIKRQSSRYEPVYNRHITRTDDTYESQNNRYNPKNDRRSRDSNSYESGNIYKAYYLPRVSISPYGTVSNGSSLYGSRNNLETHLPKMERHTSGDRGSVLEMAVEKRRERPKSGDKTFMSDSMAAKRNSNQEVSSQFYPLVNGEIESARRSVLLAANDLTNANSISRTPSVTSNSKIEIENEPLLKNSEKNRIPNKVLEKCKEGINTVSGRQMKKNRESLEGLILDESCSDGNSCALNECMNTNTILSQQDVLNDVINSQSKNENMPPEFSLDNKIAEDNDNTFSLETPPDVKEENLQPSTDNIEISTYPCEENCNNVQEENSKITQFDENHVESNQTTIPFEHEEPAQRSLHYAVSAPISHNSSAIQYEESWTAVENSQLNQPGRHSGNRESKLAALAVELEQARHSENGHKQDAEYTTKAEESKERLTYHQHKGLNEKDIKEESQKNKKSKFSLKKLLKRSKDTDGDTSVSSKNSKNADYDKSTLRLKIVHPMDMIETSGFNNLPVVNNVGTNGSLQDVRSTNEESEFLHQSSRQDFQPVIPPSQSISASNRGKKSERPSKPPPPPKCQQASSKQLDLMDLTIPTKNLIQQNGVAKSQNDENPYDVPRNVIPKSEIANKLNCTEQDTKLETLLPQLDETYATLQDSKPIPSDNEVIYEVAHFPTRSPTDKNTSIETNRESLNLGETVNDTSSISESPISDEAKKSSNPHSESNCVNNKQTQKAWITLEHSYAVVTAANHEVLAKFLDTAAEERCQQLWKPENTSLQWADFEIAPNSLVKILDDKVVIDATFRHGLKTDVTLLVANQNLYPLPCGKGDSTYPVLGYFVDDFPHGICEDQLPVTVGAMSTVYIVQRAELDTLQGYCSSTSMDESLIAEKTFIILQLIHFLKVLKSRNIQQVPDLCNTFLTRTNEEMNKLILLTDANSANCNVEKLSLCQFALSVIKRIFQIGPDEDAVNSLYNVPSNYRKIFSAVIRLLMQEKSFSLQQTQCFVEYALWGPTTVVQNCRKNLREMDVTLQRWLDTERAKCLRSVVRTLCRANVVTFLSSYDEYHADFLLKTSVRSLREVAMKS